MRWTEQQYNTITKFETRHFVEYDARMGNEEKRVLKRELIKFFKIETEPNCVILNDRDFLIEKQPYNDWHSIYVCRWQPKVGDVTFMGGAYDGGEWFWAGAPKEIIMPVPGVIADDTTTPQVIEKVLYEVSTWDEDTRRYIYKPVA